MYLKGNHNKAQLVLEWRHMRAFYLLVCGWSTGRPSSHHALHRNNKHRYIIKYLLMMATSHARGLARDGFHWNSIHSHARHIPIIYLLYYACVRIKTASRGHFINQFSRMILWVDKCLSEEQHLREHIKWILFQLHMYSIHVYNIHSLLQCCCWQAPIVCAFIWIDGSILAVCRNSQQPHTINSSLEFSFNWNQLILISVEETESPVS